MGVFAERASMRELATLSRSLGTSLHSGIDIIKAVDLAARKTRGKLNRVVLDIKTNLQMGNDLASSIEKHDKFFPDLFSDMVHVGEETGALPEVLRSLSRHYESNLKLRREFWGQISLPLLQLVAAVLIIAGLILLLGWIGEMTGNSIDVLGWGLMGPTGAMLWLGSWAMGLTALFIGYQLVSTSLNGQKLLHRTLMSIPVVGGCMRSFAIARFSWAFHLTQQAGMPIEKSMEASLRATSNGAFIAATPDILSDIRAGATLHDALDNTGLFTMEFIQVVYVAETSGTVPEALDRLSPTFEEDARRSLSMMAIAFGWLIRAGVAAFIIFVVFTIVFWYLNLLNQFL